MLIYQRIRESDTEISENKSQSYRESKRLRDSDRDRSEKKTLLQWNTRLRDSHT